MTGIGKESGTGTGAELCAMKAITITTSRTRIGDGGLLGTTKTDYLFPAVGMRSRKPSSPHHP